MGEHDRRERPATSLGDEPGGRRSDPSSLDVDPPRLALSALYDGQAQGAELDLAVRACSSDPEVMRAWQDWHLIGDVMRSQDLAPARGRDEAFLERLRAELAREPIVLAPLVCTGTAAPAHMPPRRVPRLRSALAVAAGFLTVAVVLWLVQGETRGPSEGWQATLADFGRASGLVPAEEPSWQAVDGRLIRDAQLDSYLRAHRAGAAALPGGVTGRFETVVLEP